MVSADRAERSAARQVGDMNERSKVARRLCTAILNWARSGTSSQWRQTNASAMWSCRRRTYFLQTFSIGAFWDKDECVRFWGQKLKVQGHSGEQHAENALFGLLARYLENYWTEFHQTFSVNARTLGQGVKGQGHSMTEGPAGGSI